IPVTGKASHAYFLMAGSTNHMQSRFDNAEIRVNYQDGTSSVLKIRNPHNWSPIEQDYYIDDYAFAINAVKPPRLYLKQGRVIEDFKQYKTIQGYTSYAVDGGAAQILDLPLDSSKKLKNITLKTIANEVVVGLMSVTLER